MSRKTNILVVSCIIGATIIGPNITTNAEHRLSTNNSFSVVFSNIHISGFFENYDQIRIAVDNFLNLSNCPEYDPQKIVRWLRSCCKYGQLLTNMPWQHDPLLFINSIGTGWCDDLAAVTAQLWKHLGYESRVWFLEGHVVPEVYHNGRWELYDPSFPVWFYCPNGSVAGVEDLAANVSLITNPINPIYPSVKIGDIQGDPYDLRGASIYNSTEDNWIEEFYMNEKTFDGTFILPLNTIYKIIQLPPSNLTSWDGAIFNECNILSVYIGSGFSGWLNVPLTVFNVDGICNVTIDGKPYLDMGMLNSWLKTSHNEPINPLHISTQDGAVVSYLINPTMVTP